MKHGNTHYMQLTRKLFSDENYKNLSQNAKWLFVVLNELEHRYTGKNEDFFTRSDAQLAADAQMSLSTLKRTKKELTNTDLIQTWQCHWIYKDTGKKSQQHYTAYRILK